MRFEVVISVWDEGLFRYRERLESDNVGELVIETQAEIRRLQAKIMEEKEKFAKQMEDDDIPF